MPCVLNGKSQVRHGKYNLEGSGVEISEHYWVDFLYSFGIAGDHGKS